MLDLLLLAPDVGPVTDVSFSVGRLARGGEAGAALIVAHSKSLEEPIRVTLSSAIAEALDGLCASGLDGSPGRFVIPGHDPLPESLALRLSGHMGPVFSVDDPVRGSRTFAGTHISRAARVEPVTPPGAVYVTEPFAADLELSGSGELRCDYVGQMPTAKDYGRLRMYRLRRQVAKGPP